MNFSNNQHMRMLSGLDTAWMANGMQSHSWRMVQLETCKLLELGCVLPATVLPNFQMYRWAFVVGSQGDSNSSDIVSDQQTLSHSTFIPHCIRIAQFMDLRYTSHAPVSEKYFLVFDKSKILISLSVESFGNERILFGAHMSINQHTSRFIFILFHTLQWIHLNKYQ